MTTYPISTELPIWPEPCELISQHLSCQVTQTAFSSTRASSSPFLVVLPLALMCASQTSVLARFCSLSPQARWLAAKTELSGRRSGVRGPRDRAAWPPHPRPLARSDAHFKSQAHRGGGGAGKRPHAFVRQTCVDQAHPSDYRTREAIPRLFSSHSFPISSRFRRTVGPSSGVIGGDCVPDSPMLNPL